MGRWREPFDPNWYFIPGSCGDGSPDRTDFTEANAWQYSFHVLHDVPGLVEAFGGTERLVSRLDALFATAGEGVTSCEDATGMIGQYAHGNEPCHHVPYLYALVGERDKTVQTVERICRHLYDDTPGGLCGNDDCGQLSAWYVFATLGFYPYNPASGEYVLAAPRVRGATLELQCGAKLRIVSSECPQEGKTHVRDVFLNGRPVCGQVVRHADLLKGRELRFSVVVNKGAEPPMSGVRQTADVEFSQTRKETK